MLITFLLKLQHLPHLLFITYHQPQHRRDGNANPPRTANFMPADDPSRRLRRGRWRCPNEVPGHRGWSVRGGGPHYVVSSPLLVHPLVGVGGFDQPCSHWGLRVILPGASVHLRESTESKAHCREARSHWREFRQVSD